jgi:hypothetical protein
MKAVSLKYFDDMEGRFQARLKHTSTETKYAMGGEFEGTSNVANLEAKFDMQVFDRLHDPTFVAIERETTEETIHLIYEVTSVHPMHYQMLGVTASVPQQIREEFLQRVSSSWGHSQETWIDLGAFHTGYKMVLEADSLKFERSKLTPLPGSVAHMLSKEAVQKLLCVTGGMQVGRVKGFDIGLEVDDSSLVRYHIGVFGFTGTGKSNLTSSIIHSLMKRDEKLKVCILDVSGEYSVHLLDLLDQGVIYSSEEFKDLGTFVQSQVIPETLGVNDRIEGAAQAVFSKLYTEGRIRQLALEEQTDMWDLERVYEILGRMTAEKKAGLLPAETAFTEIRNHFTKKGIPRRTTLSELDNQDISFLTEKFSALKEKLHEKSSAVKDVEEMIEILRSPSPADHDSQETPEKLAADFLSGKERLLIVYTPDPSDAQYVAARFLDRLLFLKKVIGFRQKVLIVLDEAQEFATNNPKGTQAESSRVVEALLRQGRKYGASALISTQRVAYLNTNALQQLHSYFVSTLPRSYDRLVIADSFSLDLSVLQKTTELETGEWLFVSYKATKQKNVPVFIEAPNNEDTLRSFLT